MKNHISVQFCSSPNLSNNPNYHLPMRTMYFSITISQGVFTKYFDARTTFNGLPILSIHRNKDFDLDDIVNWFTLKNEKRMTLMNILETDDASN